MKKTKTKTQKGITLIALIITIIILLILAVVAIMAVQGDSIIAHAKNARTQYEIAAEGENATLKYYTEYIMANTAGWNQDKTEVKNEKTKQILTVGQTITNYTAGGKTWKVLGAEDGHLLLMSTTNINDKYKLDGNIAGWNTAENRFVKAEKELDDECKLAISDIGEAISIRSAKVEDINRVTGYNPEITGDGEVCEKGEVWQYGNEVTYSLKNGKVIYTSLVKSADISDYTSFTHPDGRKIGEDGLENITVKSNSYMYHPDTLLTVGYGTIKGIERNSEAYKLLFLKEDGKTKSSYWLASSCVGPDEGYVGFDIRRVYNGFVEFYDLWTTNNGSGSDDTQGIRPVVTLSMDFRPEV